MVLCIGPYAIKIGKGTRGRRCNLYEAALWKRANEARRKMLCPVMAKMPFGVALLMPRAEPLDEQEKNYLININGFPDWDYVPPDETAPFEFKASDWGRLEGRLVALGYSAPALSAMNGSQGSKLAVSLAAVLAAGRATLGADY